MPVQNTSSANTVNTSSTATLHNACQNQPYQVVLSYERKRRGPSRNGSLSADRRNLTL